MIKRIIFITSFLLTVLFLTYCFYPVIIYDTKLSQHVNHSPAESLAPWRIYLIDRNGEVITDKMYPNGYYKFIDTSECFSPPQSPSTEGEANLGEQGEFSCKFVQALIQVEDKNYYSHWGVNLPAKLRAIRDNFSGKRVSGGSTITEQYVKNKYFKNHKRSYLQKMREAVLALYFSLPRGGRWLSESEDGGSKFITQKNHILNIYYHDAYFGNHLYGVGAAIEVYFGKESLEDLTEEEIVILLSLLHNPGIQSLEEEYFRTYFDQVKQRLGYDFKRTYTGKLPQKNNIDRFPFVTQNAKKLPLLPGHSFLPLDEGELWVLPHRGKVNYEVREDTLEWRCPKDGGSCSWVESTLSIDAELQQFSKDILNQTLSELKGKNVTNGAIFAIKPSSWEVLIYQGSKDFYASDIDGQVDVIQARRQPGSTMKPFLYLLALESGANPDDLILDIESEYNSFQEGKVYISENYSLKQYGLVRLKKALGNSFNNASVRLGRELGLQKVYEFYEKYGFEFDFWAEHYGYSLVLGNPSIPLEGLVRSYAQLLPATTPPVFVNSDIPLHEGEQVDFQKKQESPSWREMSEGQRERVNKFLLYDILSDSDNRDVSFGVNSILNTSIPQAVKTGTSSDFRDNLVLSYHPDFVLGAWIGNNDNSSMQGVTGITWAGYVWHQIIEKAISLGYISDREIPLPEWITNTHYCLDSKCFRRENIYSRSEKQYESRLAEGSFAREDVYESLSQYEISKLEELWIEMR